MTATKKSRTNKSKKLPTIHYLIHAILIATCVLFVLPLVLVVSTSFTDEGALARFGYSLIPSQFSTLAYQFLLKDPTQLLRAYGVSALVALVGSAISLMVMALLAYPLSRKEFRYGRILSFIVFFTMLFNGGLVASYVINTRYLGLGDTLWILILPYLVVAFYVLLLRTYFAGLPSEIIEAARIDGASEWRIFFGIVLPLSTPALATVGLFMLLLYWNDYFLSLLYINNQQLFPLQLLLFKILNNIQFLSNVNDPAIRQMVVNTPTESIRMAMAVLATGPVAFAFLLLQRYFVRGLTLGSVKG
jgi:putative aldouronate transport system permease protein